MNNLLAIFVISLNNINNIIINNKLRKYIMILLDDKLKINTIINTIISNEKLIN